jgi:hypothetical protein
MGEPSEEQRRKARRTVIILAIVAVALYFGEMIFRMIG